MVFLRSGTATGEDALFDPEYEALLNDGPGEEASTFNHQQQQPEDENDDKDPDYAPPEEEQTDPEPEAQSLRSLQPTPQNPNNANQAQGNTRTVGNHRPRRSKNAPYVFVLPIPNPGELKTLYETFERPDAKRSGWGIGRNTTAAIEQHWTLAYNWDPSIIRFEMDYGLQLRNFSQFRSHQVVKGQQCDRCFALGIAACQNNFVDRCRHCVKYGVRCTYTDRRTVRTRELTGERHAAAAGSSRGAQWIHWQRSDQPFVRPRMYVPPGRVSGTSNNTPPLPQTWRDQDAQLDAIMDQTGHDPHQNPMLYPQNQNDHGRGVNQYVWDPAFQWYDPKKTTGTGQQLPYQQPVPRRLQPPQPLNLTLQFNQGFNSSTQTPYQGHQFPQMPQLTASGQQIGQAFSANPQGVAYGTVWNQNGPGSATIGGALQSPNNHGPGERQHNDGLTREQWYINKLYKENHAMNQMILALMFQNKWSQRMILKLLGAVPECQPHEPYPADFCLQEREIPFPLRVSGQPPMNPCGSQGAAEGTYQQPQAGDSNPPPHSQDQSVNQSYAAMGSGAASYSSNTPAFDGAYPGSDLTPQGASFPTSVQPPQYPPPPAMNDPSDQGQTGAPRAIQARTLAVTRPTSSAQHATGLLPYTRYSDEGQSDGLVDPCTSRGPSDFYNSLSAQGIDVPASLNRPAELQQQQQSFQGPGQAQQPPMSQEQMVQYQMNTASLQQQYQQQMSQGRPWVPSSGPASDPVLEPATQPARPPEAAMQQLNQLDVRYQGPMGLLPPPDQQQITSATAPTKRPCDPTTGDNQLTAKRARLEDVPPAQSTRRSTARWLGTSQMGLTGLQEIQARPTTYAAAGYDVEMGARLNAAAQRNMATENTDVNADVVPDMDGDVDAHGEAQSEYVRVPLPQGDTHQTMQDSSSGEEIEYGDQASSTDGASRQNSGALDDDAQNQEESQGEKESQDGEHDPDDAQDEDGEPGTEY